MAQSYVCCRKCFFFFRKPVNGCFLTTESTQMYIFSYQTQTKKRILKSCFTKSAICQIVSPVEFTVDQVHQVPN